MQSSLSSPSSDFDEFSSAFAATSQEFLQSFLSQLGSAGREGTTLTKEAETEGCAAVWSASKMAFDTASIAAEDRAALLKSVMQYMVPFWLHHCIATRDIQRLLDERSANYRPQLNAGNVVGTANAILSVLVRAAGIPQESQALATRMLASVLAHRMFTDVRRIEEFSRKLRVARRE